MEKKFKKWHHANYEIEIIVSKTEENEAKDLILKHFQKDFEMAGFRKWQAPLDIVEKNTKPEYIQMAIYEHLINKGLQELIKDHPELKLIGEPYNFKQTPNGDTTTMTMTLDIFPEVEVLSDDWQKEQLPEIKSAATEEEIHNGLTSLKMNYADYQDTDIITWETIAKVGMVFLDKDGKELEKWHNYVWKQEFEDEERNKRYQKEFINKKKWDKITVAYDEKKLPPVYHYKKTEWKAVNIEITVEDVKKIVLPEINEDMLKKLFGPESEVKNEQQLLDFIKESISHQKFETELVKRVEDLLQKVKEKHMKVAVPQTLVEQEFSTRLKSLMERFGGNEKMTEYFKKIGDEQGKKFLEDIKKAAADSLEKFFILQKIVEKLELDVNREKPGHLEIEQKLFEKMGKWHDHHHDHGNEAHAHHEHTEHHDHHHEHEESDHKGNKPTKSKKTTKK